MRFWDKLFRRDALTGMAAATAGQAAAQTGQVKSVNAPWVPKGTPAASMAMQYVEALLLNALKTERGVHAETILTAVGALAGFSAQHAIWESVIKPGKLPAQAALVHVYTQNGETYYFGDLLNSYLLPQRVEYGPPDVFTLYSFVSAAVVTAGKKELAVADLNQIFAHVSQTVGGPDFGIPRVPKGHQVFHMPREALNKLWPETRKLLQYRDPTVVGDEWTPRPPEDWPMIIGLVAQGLITKTKDVLNPQLGMRLVFEAAIPMSKVDPKTVP